MTALVSNGKTAASKTATSKRCVKESGSKPSLVPVNLGVQSRKQVQRIRFELVGFLVPTFVNIVLSSENLSVISSIALEYEKRDTLRRHGSSVCNRLLFCGPPNCGKTLTAEVFAHEVGLDLYIVRLNRIISSYLGETAGKIWTIIEAAERCPSVLFFGEFDALAQAG